MNSGKKFKSLTMALVIATSSLLLQACSDEEVDTALTVLLVAAIIADDGPDTTRPPKYHECYDHHSKHYCDTNLRPHERRGFALTSTAAKSNLLITNAIKIQAPVVIAKELTTTEKIERIATKYNLSIYAAEKLHSALEKAQAKDFSGIDEIGIARSDVKAIYENKSLTRYSVVNMSASLGISYNATKDFVKNLQNDIQLAKVSLNK